MSDYQKPSLLSLSGRIRRTTYGLRLLAIALPLAFLQTALESSGDPGAAGLGALVLFGGALLLLPSAVQRLHDAGRSGHWLWLSFIPVLGLGVGLYILFASGTDGPNTYGPDPKGRAGTPEITGTSPAPPSPAAAPRDRTQSSRVSEPDVTRKQRESTDRVKKEAIPSIPTPRPAPQRPLPPPTPKAPQVEYDVSALTERKRYPQVRVPKAGAPVQPHRTGKAGRAGYKEDDFAWHLRRHFGGEVRVETDYALAVAGGARAYEPDLVLHVPALHLYVDIEVDEPYNGRTRQPTHCAGSDEARDRFFTSRGWCVVRLTERSVHEQPEGACRLLAALLSKVVPGYEVPEALADARMSAADPWDGAQASAWADARYRERYLGITSFGSTEEGDALYTEALTPDEQAAADATAPVVPEERSKPPSAAPPAVRTSRPVQPPPPTEASPTVHTRSHPRDCHITFDAAGHVYTIRGDADTVSVTELIDRHFPEFDGPAVARRVSQNPRSTYFGQDVQDIVAGFEAERAAATEAGQALHEQIEAHLHGKPTTDRSEEFGYFKRFLADHPELEPYRTEWRIYDKERMLAGTVDALFRRPDGSIVMYDWKRSKEIKKANRWQSGLGPLSHLPDANYQRAALQQNLYRNILQRLYGVQVAEMNLLALHPNHGRYQLHPLPSMPDEVQALLASISG